MKIHPIFLSSQHRTNVPRQQPTPSRTVSKKSKRNYPKKINNIFRPIGILSRNWQKQRHQCGHVDGRARNPSKSTSSRQAPARQDWCARCRQHNWMSSPLVLVSARTPPLSSLLISPLAGTRTGHHLNLRLINRRTPGTTWLELALSIPLLPHPPSPPDRAIQFVHVGHSFRPFLWPSFSFLLQQIFIRNI